MSEIIFRNVKVFDGTGAAPFAAEVKITGNRIAAVSTNGETLYPSDEAIVIDGQGKTLMPGLIDAHTHLGLGSTVEVINKPSNMPDAEAAMIMAHCGRVMLDYGYTGAYSGGSGSIQGELACQKAFAAGWLPGPRLVTSSFERVPGGPMGLMVKFDGLGARECDVQDVVNFVEEMADAGAQAVKFLLNGVSAFDAGTNMTEQFYDEEIMAAAAAAHKRGVWLTAHCYTAHSIKLAIKAGFHMLYHCTYADDEALELISANKDKLFVGIAPGIVEADYLRAPKFGVMASDEQKAEQADAVERVKNVGAKIRELGVRSLPGGDYGFPWNPIGKNARDLELFVEWFGYTPAQTLKAATSEAAESMGMGSELGKIQAGYLADILLVDGDPTQNIGLLTDKNNLHVIMKDGKIYKQS